ncbi:MAG: DUF1615 family protein [Patescibacteria group bacterium]
MAFEKNNQSQETQITVEHGQTLGSIVQNLCGKKDLKTLKVGCVFLQERNPEKILNVNAIEKGVSLTIPANFKNIVKERVDDATALAKASAEFDRQYAEYQADPKGSLHRQTEAAKTEGHEVVVAADEQLQGPLPQPVSVIFPQPAGFMPPQETQTPDEVPYYLRPSEDMSELSLSDLAASAPVVPSLNLPRDASLLRRRPEVQDTALTLEDQKLLREMSLITEANLAAYSKRGENVHLISFGDLTRGFSDEQNALVVKIQNFEPEQFGLRMAVIQSKPLDKAHAYFALGSPDVPLSLDAKRAFQAMAQACEDATGEELIINSGYRSQAHQMALFLQKLVENNFDYSKTTKLVALPGYSEHQDSIAMALDLRTKNFPAGSFQKSPAFAWMLANAERYNFHLSYEKDNEQGVLFEPWHWQFGKPEPAVAASPIAAPAVAPEVAVAPEPAPAPALPEAHEADEADEAEVARWKEFVFGKLAPMGDIKVVAEAEHKTSEQLARETADALIDAMVANGMPLNTQTIAICLTQLSREGAFYEDPLIPDPNEMYARYKSKMEGEINQFLAKFHGAFEVARPLINCILVECEKKYKPRLMDCKTEHQLNDAFAFIAKDIEEHPTATMQALFNIPRVGSLIQDEFKERIASYKNPVRRIGALQVDTGIALSIARQQGENLTEDQMRDRLFNRRQNLVYGLALLKDSMDAYTIDGKMHVDYVFADYNAGRYASRNAALQGTVSLLGQKIVPDGDLLMYDSRGNPLEDVSKSEEAIQKVVAELGISLTDEQIRDDLLHEKLPDFVTTQTYQLLRQAYKGRFGDDARVAQLPQAKAVGNKEKMGFVSTVKSYVKGSKKIYDELRAYIA